MFGLGSVPHTNWEGHNPANHVIDADGPTKYRMITESYERAISMLEMFCEDSQEPPYMTINEHPVRYRLRKQTKTLPQHLLGSFSLLLATCNFVTSRTPIDTNAAPVEEDID